LNFEHLKAKLSRNLFGTTFVFGPNSENVFIWLKIVFEINLEKKTKKINKKGTAPARPRASHSAH